MRTPTILITLMSVMVVVFAGVALAKVINGDDNDNRLSAPIDNDTINGKGGDDFINGRRRHDKLDPWQRRGQSHRWERQRRHPCSRQKPGFNHVVATGSRPGQSRTLGTFSDRRPLPYPL